MAVEEVRLPKSASRTSQTHQRQQDDLRAAIQSHRVKLGAGETSTSRRSSHPPDRAASYDGPTPNRLGHRGRRSDTFGTILDSGYQPIRSAGSSARERASVTALLAASRSDYAAPAVRRGTRRSALEALRGLLFLRTLGSSVSSASTNQANT